MSKLQNHFFGEVQSDCEQIGSRNNPTWRRGFNIHAEALITLIDIISDPKRPTWRRSRCLLLFPNKNLPENINLSGKFFLIVIELCLKIIEGLKGITRRPGSVLPLSDSDANH